MNELIKYTYCSRNEIAKLSESEIIVIKKFIKKHGFQDFEIVDLQRKIFQFADYYIDFDTIKIDVETRQPKSKLEKWYYLMLETENRNLTYKKYCGID